MAESSSKAPVIAGLAIGVGFIVGFSSLIYVSNGCVFSAYQREGTALSLSSSPSSLPIQGYIELKGDNALDAIFPRRMAAVVEKVLSDPDVFKLVSAADSVLLENNFEGFDGHPHRLRIVVSGERELGGSWQTHLVHYKCYVDSGYKYDNQNHNTYISGPPGITVDDCTSGLESDSYRPHGEWD